MPSPTKFHHFKVTTFHGLVYCDYCAKMLWGLARQGVQCSECGYHCHDICKDMALQCRPPRRFSPDSLSVTDSEAESIGKHSSPRGSLDIKQQQQQNNGTDDSTFTTTRSTSYPHSLSKRHQQLYLDATYNNYTQQKEEALKSPTYSSTPIDSSQRAPVKAYRKALKQQVQHSLLSSSLPGEANDGSMMTPQQTAKTFTRLVARSRAFSHLSRYFYDIYDWKSSTKSLTYVILWSLLCLYPMIVILLPPILIILLFFRSGVQNRPANQILLPRYDEGTPEYYVNLERMQSTMVFMIRLYDNLSYHLQHASLNENVYRMLFVMSVMLTVLLYMMGRWLVLTFGLVVLLNKTWLGGVLETVIQMVMEMLQTIIDVIQRITFPRHRQIPTSLEVSLYENQRWWAGTGYTSQLLRSERTPWSNITGTEPLPSKENMPPPSHYQWADDDWQLDMTGPWSDEILGLVSLIECDEQGWVYSDHKWANPRSRPESLKGESARALTRRRRWYRKAKPMEPTTKKKI
ncbi:integral peroxisomal membrane peroxin-domain-containing protein [Halteromyces radiatus]|uniref:integral peroxisomal membrane peroxin-domain-containing protein n=1 Tax=Halteromyces radiatus TaxID=101107 RepID=UPI00221F6281|nr:integral peroxisomal membrane peroxin-domain-containing protein [Halteromyces radiatus]KAI8089000.1 integral peroxisomal membrane peroxin-domain-containing protein [Halteromyces radiatus]